MKYSISVLWYCLGLYLGIAVKAQSPVEPPAVAFLTPKWSTGEARNYRVTSLFAKVYNHKDTSYIGNDAMDMHLQLDSVQASDGGYHFSARFSNSRSNKELPLSQKLAKAREGMTLHLLSSGNGKFVKLVNVDAVKAQLSSFIANIQQEYSEDLEAQRELAKWKELLEQDQQLLQYFAGEFQQLTTFLGERVSFRESLMGNTYLRPLDGSKPQPAMATLTATWNQEHIKASMTQETAWIKTSGTTTTPPGNSTTSEETKHKIIAEVVLDPKRWPEQSVNFQSAWSNHLEIFKARVIRRIP
jgi:hypothetical protein